MRVQSAIVNADLEVGLLPQIPENEIVELQLQISEIPNLSDEQSELQCHNVDQKIHAIAAAIFLCGIGAFEVCVFAIPGFYRLPNDTVHSPYMSPLQIKLCTSSYLISGVLLISTGLMALSTLCMDEVSFNFKRAMTIATFAGAFFELAPVIIMFS